MQRRRATRAEKLIWEECVYEAIAKDGPITCRELVFKLHKEKGFVYARLKALHEKELIVRDEKRMDRFTGIFAYTWKVRGML